LEEPQPAEGVLVIELGPTPQELVEEIKTKLDLTSKDWVDTGHSPIQAHRNTFGLSVRSRRQA
jgi:hypothetical protein